jgi:hypothetical protein
MRRCKRWQFGAMLALALAPMLLCGRAPAAVISAPMRTLAGLAAAEPLPPLLARHHYRHHRRRHLETDAPVPKPEAPVGDSGLAQQDVSKPLAPEAPKPPAKEGPGTKTETAPEPMGPPPPPEKWSAAEIEAGRIDCFRRIWGLKILFEPLDPVKEGACGIAAPVRLLGFDYGPEPALFFSPAPMVSCKLAANLRRWADEVLQPSAKAHLHARIVTITTLSSYHCRPRYDDPGQRISEHAFANAIDISEFITDKGERIGVLDNWNSKGERSAFLHAIHDGACEIFGTTLGPEANEAHNNHFHLDMKERRHPLCDFTPEQIQAREEARQKTPATEVSPGSGRNNSAASPEVKPR